MALTKRAALVCRDDGAALTLMLLVLFPVLLAFAGLALDGGAKLNEAERAVAVAQEAARAAVTQADRGTAYASGRVVVSGWQAVAAARAYLLAAGYRNFTVIRLGSQRIEVAVRITRPTVMLRLVGIDTMTSTGTAIATLVSGVTGPAQ